MELAEFGIFGGYDEWDFLWEVLVFEVGLTLAEEVEGEYFVDELEVFDDVGDGHFDVVGLFLLL